jgi:iron complex transport system substrate-binding protein
MRRMKPLPVMGEERRAWLLASLGSVAGGKQVWASNEPMRIVAAGGAITETLFELGAQNLLVGVDTTSSFPVRRRGAVVEP